MLHHITIRSEYLKRDVSCRVYIPDTSVKNGFYRTLYLLHGYNESSAAWGRNTDIMELAELNQLALVMPSAGDGYYLNRENEQIKSFIGEELVETTRNQFPLSPEKKDTFLAGMSMGGFGCLLAGSSFGETFGKLACFSSAFVVESLPYAGQSGLLKTASRAYFESVFGELSSVKGSSNDPEAEAERALKEEKLPPVLFACGSKDPLYEANRTVYLNLRNKGADVLWKEMICGHSWYLVNQLLEDVIKWMLL